MTIIDANIVLRYVLDDHQELSPKAADILEHQIVILPIEAACEFKIKRGKFDLLYRNHCRSIGHRPHGQDDFIFC